MYIRRPGAAGVNRKICTLSCGGIVKARKPHAKAQRRKERADEFREFLLSAFAPWCEPSNGMARRKRKESRLSRLSDRSIDG